MTLQRAGGNKAVAKAMATATIGSVRASTTPDGTPDRFPPNVDTPVAIALHGLRAGRKVTVRTKATAPTRSFSPGEVLINGKASDELSASGTVTLRGTVQTAIALASQLSLVVEQAGEVIGSSPPFAVTSLPIGMDVRKDSDLGRGSPLRGLRVAMNVRSDSGNPADLDMAAIKERVEIVTADGAFTGITTDTSDWTKCDVELHDKHCVRPDWLKGPGLFEVHQTFVWQDKRTGTADKPMRNSGFVIRMVLASAVPKGLFYIVTKMAAPTTALGVASAAGTGMAQSVQDV